MEDVHYGSTIKSEEIIQNYNFMMDICMSCISACEGIGVFR